MFDPSKSNPPVQHQWLEDVCIGLMLYSPGRTITEADIGTFGGLTGDLCQLHTNAVVGAASEFGSRIAHGMLGLSIAHGLMVRVGQFGDTGLALLGWDKIRFTGPIRIGDTVQSRWQAIETRESRSRPGAGIVVDQLELINQNNEIILTGEVATLVRKRPVATSG